MEDYFFYKSIRRTTIQFLDIFNDIYIKRYDTNGNIKGTYKVPLRFGPKTKAYLWMIDLGRDEEMLPMISVYTTGIDFDPTRLTNRHQDIKINTEDGAGIYAKSAMPYNISFTVNIYVLHMIDGGQILEQILPYFAPHAFIRVKIPEMDTLFDVKVICNGCSSIATDDMGEEEDRILKWDVTFVAQTWLFKPVETKQLIGTISGFVSASAYSWTSGMGTTGFGDSGTSGKIVNRYYMDEDTFAERDDPEKEIFVDERPSEVYAFRPIGYDEDAKLMLDYETWSGVREEPAQYTISVSTSGTGTTDSRS